MTVDEVYAAIIRNIPFIRGITVSGGECSLYLEFLEKLFGLCQKSGLSCLMDSNGMVPLWDKAVLNFCEGVMLDVKSWSAKYFHQLTGADNDIVLKNMEELARIGKLFEIRIVCITGIVDADEVIKGAGRRLSQEVKNQLLLKLIRFRNHGVTGEFKTFPPPSAEYMYRLKDLANENGFKKIRMVM
jgi:pyruvate formate lyase activating enzyme